MTTAKNTFGAQLWMGPAGGSIVKLAELLTFTAPRITRDVEDATNHDSPGGAEEFISNGVYNSGEIPFQGHYVAGSTLDDALRTASTTGALQDIKLVPKAATGTEDLEGSGYIIDYGPDEFPVKGKQTFSGTLKLTGPTTQAASA